MRHARSIAVLTLTLVISALAVSPGAAQRAHGRRRTSTAASKPPNASEPYCRSRARDYAYEKHADVGQERAFFNRCMGGR